MRSLNYLFIILFNWCQENTNHKRNLSFGNLFCRFSHFNFRVFLLIPSPSLFSLYFQMFSIPVFRKKKMFLQKCSQEITNNSSLLLFSFLSALIFSLKQNTVYHSAFLFLLLFISLSYQMLSILTWRHNLPHILCCLCIFPSIPVINGCSKIFPNLTLHLSSDHLWTRI